MKFSCHSQAFQKAVGVVDKAVPSKTSMQVLENVYLNLQEGVVNLVGNDLEIGIKNSLPVENYGDNASILVKSKILLSILSKMQNQMMHIEVNERNQMSIKSEHVDFDILCAGVEGYPEFPQMQNSIQFQLKVSELKEFIKHTLFSVSLDETKQFLNGILLKSDAGVLHFVSTDGYRLALRKQSLESDLGQFYAIVPYKAMNELNKIIQGFEADKFVEIAVSDTQISFRLDSFYMISRLIEGRFPDYNQVLPKETLNSFTLNRRVCLDACERASIIATSSNNIVRFNLQDTVLTIKANSVGLGEFQEEITVVRTSGEGEVKIAFDVKLMIEALKNIESDDFVLKCNEGVTPVIFEPSSAGEYLYVIMPIRANDFQAA